MPGKYGTTKTKQSSKPSKSMMAKKGSKYYKGSMMGKKTKRK